MVKVVIQKKINEFNKIIKVDGDKSLSIRSLLIGSQSYGVCNIKNLSMSNPCSKISCFSSFFVEEFDLYSNKQNYCSVYKWHVISIRINTFFLQFRVNKVFFVAF